jgi:hypothetical protein
MGSSEWEKGRGLRVDYGWASMGVDGTAALGWVIIHRSCIMWGDGSHSHACMWLRPFQVLRESNATVGFVPFLRNGPTSVVALI